MQGQPQTNPPQPASPQPMAAAGQPALFSNRLGSIYINLLRNPSPLPPPAQT